MASNRRLQRILPPRFGGTRKRDAAALAEAAGAEFSPQQGLVVPFLGTKYVVGFHPETDIRKVGSSEEIPLPDKILIAHYLLGASGKKSTGELVTFRQIPDGHFYFDAFQRRARDPFANFFGNNEQLFVKCAEMMGGVPMDNGDYSMEFASFLIFGFNWSYGRVMRNFPPMPQFFSIKASRGFFQPKTSR